MELKTSVNVYTTVAVHYTCFTMHVGVKTSVNVVTSLTVAQCALGCRTQDLSECVYYSCTICFSVHVGVKISVVALCFSM